jgi:immunity protein, SdpI family
MHNIKPNYFAGFRLPWTLENADNWRKTHLLGGKLWFVGGLLIAVICLILPPAASMVAFYSIMTVVVIIPAVYSYRLYKKQKSGLKSQK